MTNMLEAALAYAADGWPIFPCRADKTPLTENGVLDATTNKKQIREWWGAHPKANIGLAVDRCQMMALDLDPGHDIAELEKAIGKLPKTKLVQTTPRGGKHLFYQIKEDEVVPPSASKLAPHVDVRSFNSYVLLAPSRTKDGEYEWESEGKPAFRTDAMVEKAKEGSKRQSKDHDTWIIEPDLEENVELAIAWLKKDAKIAVEGVNGDHMAYATATMMKSYGISEELAFDLMWEHWNPRCNPPWPSSEADHLEQKVRNGYSYNTSEPGNMTPAFKAAKHAQRFKPVSRETVNADGTTSVVEKTVGKFRAVDRDGIDAIKPPEWLIDGLIPEKSFGFLVGKSGTLKTFIALDMMLSLATGAGSYWDDPASWYGPWPKVKGKGMPVLMLIGEGRPSIAKRVRAWEKKHLDGAKVGSNLVIIDPVPYPDDDDIEDILNLAKEYHEKYGLVVCDTLGRAMQGRDENSQQDASDFTRMAQILQYELDCAFLAIAHEGHKEGGRARGSSVFQADADFVYTVEREEKSMFLTMKNTKQKDADEWEKPRTLQAVEINLGNGQSSLAIVQPSKKTEKAKEQERATGKQQGKKRTDKAKADLNKALRTEALAFLAANEMKTYSATKIADAIAFDPNSAVKLSAERIRKYLKDALTEDKEHQIMRCYDGMKGYYQYNR